MRPMRPSADLDAMHQAPAWDLLLVDVVCLESGASHTHVRLVGLTFKCPNKFCQQEACTA